MLDNQPVKAGQVLVRIDPRDYQARVDLAKAAAGAGREPVARAAAGGAADERDHRIRHHRRRRRSWPTPRPKWSARACA